MGKSWEMVLVHRISWDLPSGNDWYIAIEHGHRYTDILTFPMKHGEFP